MSEDSSRVNWQWRSDPEHSEVSEAVDSDVTSGIAQVRRVGKILSCYLLELEGCGQVIAQPPSS